MVVSVMFLLIRSTWLWSRQTIVKMLAAPGAADLPSLRDALLVLLLAIAVVALPILLVLLLRADPVGALPVASESTPFLGALLGAQAAIAALTLAVMLFLMQGVSTRRDVDDRVYAEYIRRSWVWPVFVGSVVAVAVTGGVLIAERLIGDAGALAQGVPGIPNLALLAVVASAVSLAAPVVLFARAIKLAEPEHWQSLRLDVNKRDVNEAVSAFLGRVRRAEIAHAAGEPDLSVLVPDAGERSADQAIRALLDDARRAMDERRHGELTRSLDSIKMLVSYAMDEIENAGVQWSSPGVDAQWPPLMELGRNLYSYREEVIKAANREYLRELLNLDYWLASTGVKRFCGELFTFGLDGYGWNYEISTRVGSRDFHGLIRDQFLLDLNGLTLVRQPETLLPFMEEVIRYQGNVLSHALHTNLVSDFRWLQREFSSILSNIFRRWHTDPDSSDDQRQMTSHLAQENRVVLMGLAGRAVILADSGELSDATPYLDADRELYGRPTDLANDVAAALRFERRVSRRQWEDWEVPEHIGGWSGTLSPERYPLTCFAILLMGLTDDATLDLNLSGNARHILDWFTANSERLARFVRETPSVSALQRREFATEVLKKAVERDKIEADLEIIRSELNPDTVRAFKADVHAGMLAGDSVERLFDQAGVSVRFDAATEDTPAQRDFPWLEPKVMFIDPTEPGQSYYGRDLGRSLGRHAIYLLCEAAEGATLISAPLDTKDGLLCAMDVALQDLAPQDDVGVVLAGDWDDILLDLSAEPAGSYEPYWQLDNADPFVDIGRYKGCPIFKGPSSGERCVYVVDVGRWGRLVRATFEGGQVLHVDVQCISPERAEELLEAHPDWFSEQLHESKLRKIQTYVEVIISVRHDFHVDDPSRARRIDSTYPPAEVALDGGEPVLERVDHDFLGIAIDEQDTSTV